MPDEIILRRHCELGGQLIALGLDAHIPQHVAQRLHKAAARLRSIGSTQAYYYNDRRAVAYELSGGCT